MKRWPLIVVALASLTGCGGPGPSNDDGGAGGGGGGAGGSGTAAFVCPTGWWLDPDSDCAVACPSAPECAAADCRFVTFLGLMPDAGSWQGAMTFSGSAGTLTSFGAATRDEWTLTADGGLRVSKAGGTTGYTCRTNALDVGLTTKFAADARMSAALRKASEADSWSSAQY